MPTAIDEKTFRQEMRELKRLIREDPAVLARYDLDGDGELSGEEWQRAVQVLREQLAIGPPQPAAAARATHETLRQASGGPALDCGLVACRELLVRQQVEMTEALSGWETANRYAFSDAATGRPLGGCDENRGGVGSALSRQFLGPARPLKLSLTATTEGLWVEGQRPWAFLGPLSPPTMELTWSNGALGTVRRVWPILFWRRYELRLAGGAELLVDGTLRHPWTFPVKKGAREVARIVKKWSGMGKELFTDADTFRVQFADPALPLPERLLILAAAMAIDFDFFETDSSN